MEKEQCAILVAMVALIAIATIGFIFTVKGSTLSLEPPPPPSIYMNGTMINLSADDQDRDISIDPYGDLAANGTQTISTTGATDVDINDFPPIGVTVLIQNASITVTNHTVDIANEFEEEAVTSNDDGNGDEDEE